MICPESAFPSTSSDLVLKKKKEEKNDDKGMRLRQAPDPRCPLEGKRLFLTPLPTTAIPATVVKFHSHFYSWAELNSSMTTRLSCTLTFAVALGKLDFNLPATHPLSVQAVEGIFCIAHILKFTGWLRVFCLISSRFGHTKKSSFHSPPRPPRKKSASWGKPSCKKQAGPFHVSKTSSTTQSVVETLDFICVA